MANPFDQFDQTVNPFDEFDNQVNTPAAVDAVTQLSQGIVKGIPNLLDAGGAVVATGAELATGQNPQEGMVEKFQGFMQQRPVSNLIDNTLGTQERPAETKIGEYMNMAGQGAATAPLAGLRMAVGAIGGIGAGIGGDLGEKYAGTPGKVVGSILGGAAAPATLGPLTQRAVSAFRYAAAPRLEQGTAQLAKRAQQMNVPLALNQVADNRVLNTAQKVSQALPFSGVGKFEQGQRQAWNSGLAKTIGVQADNLTPETVNQALKNFDTGYSSALDGVTVRVNAKQVGALDDIIKEARLSLGSDSAKTVAENVRYVKDQLKNGFVRGEKVNSIRKEIASRASKASPDIREWLGDLTARVQDVIADSLPADKADALRTLNRQYRNFKTVEPLLEKSVDGSVNPTDLLQRVASSRFIKASRANIGEDDLVDLARIGKFMAKQGGSDTFANSVLGGGSAAGIMGLVTNPGATAAVAAPTAAVLGANRVFQKGINQSQGLLGDAVKKSLKR